MIIKTFAPTKKQKEAANPAHSVWVTANAGSGKTQVLVERVVRLLLESAEPSSILCITYTKAAAAEMSARLFKKLGDWTALDDESLLAELRKLGHDVADASSLVGARRLFTRALETPGGLKIQTIHAFCEKLLHLFPVEAGLAPGFRVLDERREQEIRNDAIQHVLQLAERGTNSEFEHAFADVVAHTTSDGFAGLLREFLGNSKGLRNVLEAKLSPQDFSLALKNAFGLTLGEDSKAIEGELRAINRSSYLHHAAVLAQFKIHGTHDTSKLMIEAANSENPLKSLRKLFLTKDEKKPRDKLMANATAQAHPSTAQFVDDNKHKLFEMAQVYDLHIRIEATSSLFILAEAIHRKIESQKRQLALYDFDDLINRTAKLLNGSRAAQWVLYKLDAGLKHILVDEAQDTSPAQWQIITALADEFFSGIGRAREGYRTVFVVGDRKQSIYSFQGADVSAFVLARKYFEEKISSSGKDLNNVDLSLSFRSTQQILDVVDKVFPPEMPLQLGFGSDDKKEEPHQSSRLDEPGVVEVWPLYEPMEKEEEQPWKAPVDREASGSPRRRLAQDIAITIKSWLGKRIIAAKNRPVEPGDILILLQSRGPLFSMLIAELRRADVPVAGADRLKLLESLAIKDLLALTEWLLLPQDDYAFACILKSPLMPNPLSEDQLFELAYGRATESLWNRLEMNSDQNSETLRQWKTFANEAGPYDFFARVLTERRKAMVARLGTEAEDATNAFLDQALAYEQEHGRSLAGFLHWFMSSETSIKREMEKGTGEVRLMTVHGAKGLEANIVFLPDAANITGSNKTTSKLLRVPDEVPGAGLPFWKLGGLTKSPTQVEWEEAEQRKINAERYRLLYVAMTRACDELYVCGSKNEREIPKDCWYETIVNALGPANDDGQLRFGPEYTYIDGQAIKQEQRDVLPDWLAQPPAVESGTRIHSLTGLVSRHVSATKSYDALAARRGIAIHALLQDLPEIEKDKREAFARRKAIRLGLDEAEAAKLAHLINAPELTPFFGSESHAEAELRGRLDEGRIVSGRVDRIAILATEILLLDYKSDHFVPESVAVDHPYTKQLALYAELLKSAYPDRKVRAALFWTQGAKLEWIPPAYLTQARDQAVAELEPEAS